MLFPYYSLLPVLFTLFPSPRLIHAIPILPFFPLLLILCSERKNITYSINIERFVRSTRLTYETRVNGPVSILYNASNKGLYVKKKKTMKKHWV